MTKLFPLVDRRALSLSMKDLMAAADKQVFFVVAADKQFFFVVAF